MKFLVPALLLSLCGTATYAEIAPTDSTLATSLGQGWKQIGRQHVLDSAEKDLAVLHGGDGTVEVRLCAEGHAIRLRNAELWMAGGKRQKLWVPLVLDAGKCSEPIKVKGGPIKATHVALEYEAMSLDGANAHLSIYGKIRAKR